MDMERREHIAVQRLISALEECISQSAEVTSATLAVEPGMEVMVTVVSDTVSLKIAGIGIRAKNPPASPTDIEGRFTFKLLGYKFQMEPSVL